MDTNVDTSEFGTYIPLRPVPFFIMFCHLSLISSPFMPTSSFRSHVCLPPSPIHRAPRITRLSLTAEQSVSLRSAVFSQLVKEEVFHPCKVYSEVEKFFDLNMDGYVLSQSSQSSQASPLSALVATPWRDSSIGVFYYGRCSTDSQRHIYIHACMYVCIPARP